MTQCENCVAGLGIETVIKNGTVKVIECRNCNGVGYFCGQCDKPADRCDCPDDDKEDEGL